MSQIVVAFSEYLNFNKNKICKPWSLKFNTNQNMIKSILVQIYDNNLILEMRSNLDIAVTLDADETHQTLGSRVRWLGR